MNDFKWSIIGLSGDEGVKRTGGRTGASIGPAAFMQSFRKLSGREKVKETCIEKVDFNPEPGNLEKALEDAAELINIHQQKSDLTIIIGGGHEFSYTHLLAAKKCFPGQTIGCINIDPHMDLRPTTGGVSSGSGFRYAIEKGVIQAENLVEFGIQPFCNAAELWEFAESAGVVIIPFEKLRYGKSSEVFEKVLSDLSAKCDVVFISLDIDAIDGACAPGVSAPAPEGFSPTDVMEILKIAAREEKVKSLGAFELNPQYDIDNRTARLTAAVVYNFVAERIKTTSKE